ncbi:MAG: hypothetical protein KGZ79_14575 [Dethiobacter sp.]|jgi:hypothetical protein|nr:hypothetical protein [Dethiobacter sp.]
MLVDNFSVFFHIKEERVIITNVLYSASDISNRIVSYLRFKRRLSFATLVRENIFESDRIQSPFVLGFIKPKIYIPIGLAKEELDYILKHEATHIRRKDYLIPLMMCKRKWASRQIGRTFKQFRSFTDCLCLCLNEFPKYYSFMIPGRLRSPTPLVNFHISI